MRISILLLMMPFVLMGCNQGEPMDKAVSPNGNTADLVATVDGCRIWRVNLSRSVYFARCPTNAVSTQWETLEGKQVVRHQTIGDGQ